MNYADHIDDYMSGALSGDALKQFENQLKVDPELKRIVDEYSALKNISTGLLEMQLLQEVEEANAPPKTSIPFLKASLTRLLLLVIGIALLTFLVYRFMSNVNDKKNDTPYAFAYTEPIWPVVRDNESSNLSKGVALYLSGDKMNGKALIREASEEDRILANYWLAELFLMENQLDSVRHYLPNVDANHLKYSRINQIKAWIEN
ncbi:MAG: hypothetical protein AAGA77_23045 [Bacteroidota bacterium]